MVRPFLRWVFATVLSLGGPVWATSLWFARGHHALPRLKRPRSFSEKICAMKLYDDHADKIAPSDKVLVKHLVQKRLGEGFAIPTLWSGKVLPPLAERNWPVPFVIKANHGSAMNYFVRSEADLDWPRIERLAAEWLAQDWPVALCEEWYNKIDRQLLIEPMLSIGDAEVPDYKVFVFSGRALLV